MPSYENNAYYHPETYLLEIVDVIDQGESYEFDMMILWKDKEDRLWAGADSGCSCPTPFEDFNFPEDAHRILTRQDLRDYCKELWPIDGYTGYPATEIEAIADKAGLP